MRYFFFLLINFMVFGLDVIKVGEIEFEIEPKLFGVSEGRLIVLLGNTIYEYEKGRPVLAKEIRQGQGPGEAAWTAGVVKRGESIFLWDSRLRRLSIFREDWSFSEFQNIPKMRRAFLLDTWGDHFVYKWIERGTGGIVADTIGLFKNGQEIPLAKTEGEWVKDGNYNYSRPILVSTFSTGRLYFSENWEYKVRKLKIQGTSAIETSVLTGKYMPVAWKKNKPIRFLSKDIFPNARFSPISAIPDHVPPLFSLIADGDLVGVVTNQKLESKQTQIDLWHNADMVGSIAIPLISSQYMIVHAIRTQPDCIYLENDFIYAVHYDLEKDQWNITTWKVVF